MLLLTPYSRKMQVSTRYYVYENNLMWNKFLAFSDDFTLYKTIQTGFSSNAFQKHLTFVVHYYLLFIIYYLLLLSLIHI